MTDLVSRLLEAIGETEREAHERRGIWPHPSVQDSGAVWLHIKRGGQAVVVHYLHPVEGYGDMADLKAWAEAGYGQDEDAVLRRCAADKVIAETARMAQEHYREVLAETEGDPGSSGRVADAWRQATTWEKAARLVAQGYGLSDHQEGEE